MLHNLVGKRVHGGHLWTHYQNITYMIFKDINRVKASERKEKFATKFLSETEVIEKTKTNDLLIIRVRKYS